MPFSQDVK